MDLGGYYYVFLKNDTTDKIFKGVIELLGSKNLETLPPYKGLRPTIFLEPGEREVVAMKSTDSRAQFCCRVLGSMENIRDREEFMQMVE